MKLFLFILILSFSHIAISTEKMVLEFPNGKKFGCESCHYTKKKSNPLNVFGQDVKINLKRRTCYQKNIKI
jgi:hypothetical protein